MTTLVEELEQAASRIDCSLGNDCKGLAGDVAPCPSHAMSTSLRQRTAWVRELTAELEDSSSDEAWWWLERIRALTGPIPSETAPAAPKEGTVPHAEK